MARDLDYLNEQVKAKLEELNNAPFTATGRSDSRRQMFEDEEREYLGRLPPQAVCPLDIRVLVIDRGHCVRISGDGHRYSPPPEDTGKRVSVTITETRSTSMTWIHGAKRRAQAIKEHTGQQGSPIAGRLTWKRNTDANLANGAPSLSRQGCRKILPIV